MTEILIDGDILLYQISSSLEEPVHLGDDWWSLVVDFAEARNSVDAEIKRWTKRLGADSVIIAFSDPNHNWRLDILETYKGNRKGKRKPVVYVPLKEYLIKEHSTVCYPTLEADDVLGILAGEDRIIVSDDKDLKTIPGRLYQPRSDTLMEISEEEANRNHLYQTLTGDQVDNYSGCPGVGPVTADKVLKEGTWEEVLNAYLKKGLDEEAALTQARVARILRSDEWNTETEEVLLWNPK